MIKIKIKLKKSTVFTDTNDNQLDNIFRGKKDIVHNRSENYKVPRNKSQTKMIKL